MLPVIEVKPLIITLVEPVGVDEFVICTPAALPDKAFKKFDDLASVMSSVDTFCVE